MADGNPVPSERGRVGITIRSNENMVPAAALVITVPLQLARGQQDQCQWWRGGCQLAGAGDTVLHQEAGPTLQQCMSLCRAVAGCGYIAWSQHLLGDTTCRLLRLAPVRINLCPGASKYWRFKSFILLFISPFTITHLFK